MTDRTGDTAHNNSNWREKYLNALEVQEANEQQLELLRRLLLRVSVSAEGQDDILDKSLGQLKRLLKPAAGGGANLIPLFSDLDQAIVGLESQRKNNIRGISQALTDIVKPLQALTLSRPVRKSISDYLSDLPSACEHVNHYASLLQQLATIQQQALHDQHQPQPGLFQRLLSTGKTSSVNSEESPEDVPDSGAEKSHSAHELHDQNAQISVSDLDPDNQQNDLTRLVSVVLNDMLEKVEVPKTFEQDFVVIQQRLNQGLTATNLIPTLEQVRDVVIEAYLASNRAFANYLNNVNRELEDIYQVIGGAARAEKKRRDASNHLQDAMLEQVSNLEQNVSSATELSQLKEQVKSQLGNIRQALLNYQQGEQDQGALTTQLQTLAEKIKAMENDAENNRATMEAHRHKAMHDHLTGLPNREAYNERADDEWKRWQRYGHPLSIAICDLDHFKLINDNFGHQAGDRVLKVIGLSIAQKLRQVDFFGRYGGEEFVVLMPETNLEKATLVLEKIRAAIANTEFNYKEEPLAITVSIGVTEFQEGDTTETAFARADLALYEAKASGRNRCQVAE